MPQLQIYNLDDVNALVANLTEGEYVFGRGSLLKVFIGYNNIIESCS